MQPSEFAAFYSAHSRRLLAFFARRTFDPRLVRSRGGARAACGAGPSSGSASGCPRSPRTTTSASSSWAAWQRCALLDDLGAEFARVAAHQERRRRRFPSRALAIAASVLVLLGASAYAVPPMRAAIDDLAASFAGWFDGDEGAAPGRALRPEDDAPEWVREGGGRLIAEKAGVGLTSRARRRSRAPS